MMILIIIIIIIVIVIIIIIIIIIINVILLSLLGSHYLHSFGGDAFFIICLVYALKDEYSNYTYPINT